MNPKITCLSDQKGRTILSLLAERDLEAVVDLLRAQIEVSERALFTWSQLRPEVGIEILLRQPNVQVDAKDTDGRTALSFAARSGFAAAVRLLVDCGDADVNSRDEFGATPLLYASTFGHEATIVFLLQKDAHI